MSKSQKFDLAKIIVSAGIFAAGYLTGFAWIFIIAYVIAGYETIFKAVHGVFHGQVLDENFLMTIASIGAVYCGEYPEAVAVMLFYQVGEFFEDYAVDNSRKSIAELMDIKAEYANKLVDGAESKVDPESLILGDIILVKPGEKVPVDGLVIDGISSLNTAALTGESLPRDISPGESIISGTINMTGVLKIKVTKLYEDSTVAKVLDLVENASSKKASVEKFITKFARFYTPIVVLLAIALAIVPPLVFPDATFTEYIYNAMIFLVISCPCALVISVPLSLFAGVGSASKQGILVKGSNYLEALADVTTFAFDKTGTLTTGNFDVTKIVVSDIAKTTDLTEFQLLELAAYGESFSNHPIASSIVSNYKSKSGIIEKTRISNYMEISGKGISAIYDGSKIFCGNGKLMEDLDLPWKEPLETGSAVHVAYGHMYLGYIIVSDTIRENSASTIAGLKSLGVKQTIMLTGDRKEIAESVAKEIGITDVLSELLPGDKVHALEGVLDEKAKGHLAFVGDGINDAPVLARADVGIAMGALGSDAAIEAADVVIMTDDISKLITVKKIAKKTLGIAKQNVIFALTVKFAILILGALGMASMWAAVFADVGVAFIAILNSMRALKL
ncbi:MAG: heavy metal translocating P-type ATPase [Anaerovoracaceae bacterium]